MIGNHISSLLAEVADENWEVIMIKINLEDVENYLALKAGEYSSISGALQHKENGRTGKK